MSPELSLGEVAVFDDPECDDGALLCEALVDLLGAEWTLWGRGLDREAGRVNLARALVGTAVASEWAENPGMPEPLVLAAEAGLASLASTGGGGAS